MTAGHEVSHKKRTRVVFVLFPLPESQGVFGNNSHVLASADKDLFTRKYIQDVGKWYGDKL